MDNEKIRNLIETTVKQFDTQVVNVKVTELDSDYVTVQVTSEAFLGLSLVKRLKALAGYFEKNAPELLAVRTLIFDACTAKELSERGAGDQSQGSAVPLPTYRHAAKPAEI